MSDPIKVRVGQQNTVKVVASVSGSAGGKAVESDLAKNVVGGIASVTQLSVSGVSTFIGLSTFKNDVIIENNLKVNGISTFVGISTFQNDLYVGGNLYIRNDLKFDEFTARNANITGIATILGSLYYGNYQENGVAYFNSSGELVSSESVNNTINYTNYIFTTDNSGTPVWANAIDGGEY